MSRVGPSKTVGRSYSSGNLINDGFLHRKNKVGLGNALFLWFLPIKKNNVSRPVGRLLLSGARIAGERTFVIVFGWVMRLTTDTIKSPNLMAEVRLTCPIIWL